MTQGTRSPGRTRAIVAGSIAVVVGLIAIVLVFVLSNNIVYFNTVSEAVQSRTERGTDRFKLAGAVVPGSVSETPNGVSFEVTDGNKTVAVVHRGDPPELFKAGAPVLCEGRWGKGLTFDSDKIAIRHGEKYEPPKVDTEDAPKAKAT